MVISACEWWAHETCQKCLAWLRELKFSSCFQDGIKLWSKAVSFCLPPTLSGYFGPTGLMLAGVIIHLWIFFDFSFPKLSPTVPQAKGLWASKYFNIRKQTDQICSAYQKSFSDGMLSGFESPCLCSEMADTSWVNGPQIGETSSVTVWIFTQWVFLLRHCVKEIGAPCLGIPSETSYRTSRGLINERNFIWGTLVSSRSPLNPSFLLLPAT